MIPTSIRACQPRERASWQRELAQAIATPRELIEALGLSAALIPAAEAGAQPFRLRVPWSYVRRMRRGDPRDPLLLQVLPQHAEGEERAGFSADPLAEARALKAPGLLKKYRGRALLIATPACAIHCRYCFRREFPYAEQSDAPRWQGALDEIERDRGIEEVILSGGDPLTLSDVRLDALTRSLERAGHVRRLRIHTRLPIVLPARVDAGLTAWLGAVKWPVVIVLHANHPNEIDAEVAAACAALRAAGATLFNQSVLLAGVNDDARTLAALCERVFAAGVLPYYLHMTDPVRGTAHFAVPLPRARRIAGELAALLPGYLVPRLVRERAGAPAKVPIAPRLPERVPAI
ncbi:MAG TPA: EF-P beta-lysylation protein EpmB [Steroidobacteraceae bacterium]|nr:EF-P beta-lysylation protein EpmB [Steroidobacteraceae bacterium]